MACTLKDVASAAGVSPATVSLVLNNRSGISQETRETVIAAAMRLNYPLRTSSTVKENATRPVCFIKIASHGLVINDDHKAFISDYIDGIENSARRYGYPLEVRSYVGFDVDQILSDIYKQNYSGIIILATELLEQDILKFKELSIPKVFIDVNYPLFSFDFVNMDNESAVYTVVKRFKDRGITKIGLVKSKIYTRNFFLRSKYFYEVLKYFDMEINKDWEFTVGPSFDTAYDDMLENLEGKKDLPEGLFCVCDVIGIGVMKALREKGIKVPDDISIIGFDDSPKCRMTDPELSSVRVPTALIGKRAFEYLRNLMKREQRIASEKILIGCDVILRDSVRKVL